MNTLQKGGKYENFVANVYRAILFAENYDLFKTITIELNKKLNDKNGVLRQIDIYWEYSLLGETYRTAIECKNYESSISIDRVEAFVQKLRSLNLSHGIMATKSGFQSGAQTTAEKEGISLIIIREPKDEDWKGRVKTIHLKMTAMLPPRILPETLKLKVDWDWININLPGFDGKISINALNKDIRITDFEENQAFSFYDIENKVLPRDFPGKFSWSKDFSNSYLEYNGERYKVLQIAFDYYTPDALVSESVIDFSSHLLAIMEYVTGEKKKLAVVRDGLRKPIPF